MDGIDMSKWDKENKIDQPTDVGGTIRRCETFENSIRAHGFTLTPEQFNLIVDITALNYSVIRNFHWVKFINDIRPTNGGYNLVCDNEMAASKLFDFIGFELAQHFKTDKLATTYRGKIHRYWKVPQEEGRELSQGTKDLLNRMRLITQ